MKENNSKISLDIPTNIKKILEDEASKKEMSLSGLIRFILKEYLKINNDLYQLYTKYH